jgi:hypothetical protein
VQNAPKEVVELLHLFERGRDDPEYFAEHILGVKLNHAQKRWFRLCSRMDPVTLDWFFRRVWHLAANQIGKTVGLAILILWASHYKKGLPQGNWDFWFSSPYLWLHLAPSHPISLLTRDDLRALLLGSHPAQFDRETGKRRPMRWPAGWANEVKFGEGQYPGFRLWNGAEIHFRTTADHARGIQGMRANGISMDECAYEDFLIEVLKGTIKMRLASTGGPFWGVSTSNGLNDYYELVTEVMQRGINTFHERVWEAPKLRAALVVSHITDNAGFGLSHEEVEFMIEDQKDDPLAQQTLWGGFLNPQDAFFVPTENIKSAWVKGLLEMGPRNNHRYVIFWDVSMAQGDPTVCVILDVTKRPWRGVEFRRWENSMSNAALIEEIKKTHARWNSPVDKTGFAPRAITGFDSTSLGGKIIDEQLADISPKRPVNFAGPKAKERMLVNARAALSRKDVWIPEGWLRLLREVLTYRRDDRKLVQDSVMALIGALHLAATGWGEGQRTRPFVNGYRVPATRR